MTRRLMLIMPVVALILAAAMVVPGCGGGGAADVWFLEGLFRIWAPQLIPVDGFQGGSVSAQQIGDPQDITALTNAYIWFGENGDAWIEAELAEQTDLADVSPAWHQDLDLSGQWWWEDEDKNLVIAEFEEDESAQAAPSQWGNDYARLELQFSSNDEASGTIYVEIGWGAWAGSVAIQKAEEPN